MPTAPHILVANIFFAPFSYGGATVVAEEIASLLHASGAARVSAVSLISRAELAPYTVLRSQVDGIDNYLINVPAGRKYVDMYDNSEVGAAVDELIKQIRPDIFHVHCVQEMGADLLRSAKRAGLPLVLSIHDFWWICERQFMVKIDNVYCGQSPVRIETCKGCVGDYAAAKRRIEVLFDAAEKADIVTYPSQFALDLCEASGLAPGKGVVWQNGVHPPASDFFKRQGSRRAKGGFHVFGFLGGPSQIKGWPLIRRAFAALDREDFEVHVVDGSRDGSWWSESMISGLPGTWRVVPRFEQTEMDSFYSKIDTLLFMSQWKETFGLAIREALLRGIRVVQTDSGGTVEHPAVDRDRLISIGAGPDQLAAQLIAALESPPPAPVDGIQTFTNQAREFQDLTSPLGLTYGNRPEATVIEFEKRRA